MGANPHANGGLLLRELRLPDFRSYAVDVPAPGKQDAERHAVLGTFLRDVMKLNDAERNFRLFGPDETLSNRLSAVFETTNRQWEAETQPHDEYLAPEGRVIEVLSEHQCQGWLEGYLLTGRHGLFNCYEAFIHIVDSMFNQHAKWLKVTRELPWRAPDRVAELPAVFARLAAGPQRLHAPGPRLHRRGVQQEGRGRPRLPAAGRQLPAVGHGPLPPQPALRQHRRRRQAAVAAVAHDGRRGPALHRGNRASGTGPATTGRRARPRHGRPPATCRRSRCSRPSTILRRLLPKLKIRIVNVVDLMKLQPQSEHPHGLTRRRVRRPLHEGQADHLRVPRLSLADSPPAYRRTNHENLHVRGYKEEGTITTPFDMTVLNDIDRFHLAQDALRRLPRLAARAPKLIQELDEKLSEHHRYIREHGQDMPEIRNWRWG